MSAEEFTWILRKKRQKRNIGADEDYSEKSVVEVKDVRKSNSGKEKGLEWEV